MENRSIAIGCDHAGYQLKEYLKRELSRIGMDILDFGTDSPESADYPDFVHPVANKVESREVDFGIVICGSGNGAAMTANKHAGIRAALCWLPELARLGRLHNNANVLALPGRFVSEEEGWAITRAFMEAEFEGGRHQRRIDKIPVPK